MTGPGGLVVIGCGAAKLDHPAPAASLYTGQHFRACLRAARALVPDDRIFVLSARYGLVGLAAELEPYDLRLGQPGSVTVLDVTRQAVAGGLAGRPVLALCSARYVDVLRPAFPGVRAPLAGLGIGRQRHVLASIAAHPAEGFRP